MEKEIWKDVLNYENHYKVSSLGNVKSVKFGKDTILKKKIRNKYLAVNLTKNGVVKDFNIHQLVAIAFLNHKPNGMEKVINHINFIKTDNRVENLEIVTSRENSNLKHIKSSSKYVGVSFCKKSNKWKSYINIKKNRIHLGFFLNEIDASSAYQNKLKEIEKTSSI